MSSHLLQGTETMKERTPQLPALPIWQHNLHLLSTYFSLHHPTKDTYPFSPNSILQPLYSVMALPTSSETLFYQLFLFPLPSPLFWLLLFALRLFQPKTRIFSLGTLHLAFPPLTGLLEGNIYFLNSYSSVNDYLVATDFSEMALHRIVMATDNDSFFSFLSPDVFLPPSLLSSLFLSLFCFTVLARISVTILSESGISHILVSSWSQRKSFYLSQLRGSWYTF